MSVEIVKDNYPAFTADAQVSGKRIVTYLNYGQGATKESPKWVLLGGVTSNNLSLSTSTTDSQTKDNGYWSESVITAKSMEYTADMVMKRDNVAQMAIDAFMKDDDITAEKIALDIAVVDLDTKDYTRMRVVPTSWEQTADSEDSVQYSLSATVTGKPESLKAFVLPE